MRFTVILLINVFAADFFIRKEAAGMVEASGPKRMKIVAPDLPLNDNRIPRRRLMQRTTKQPTQITGEVSVETTIVSAAAVLESTSHITVQPTRRSSRFQVVPPTGRPHTRPRKSHRSRMFARNGEKHAAKKSKHSPVMLFDGSLPTDNSKQRPTTTSHRSRLIARIGEKHAAIKARHPSLVPFDGNRPFYIIPGSDGGEVTQQMKSVGFTTKLKLGLGLALAIFFFLIVGFIAFKYRCWKRRRISIIETGFSSSGEEDEEVIYLYMDTFSQNEREESRKYDACQDFKDDQSTAVMGAQKGQRQERGIERGRFIKEQLASLVNRRNFTENSCILGYSLTQQEIGNMNGEDVVSEKIEAGKEVTLGERRRSSLLDEMIFAGRITTDSAKNPWENSWSGGRGGHQRKRSLSHDNLTAPSVIPEDDLDKKRDRHARENRRVVKKLTSQAYLGRRSSSFSDDIKNAQSVIVQSSEDKIRTRDSEERRKLILKTTCTADGTLLEGLLFANLVIRPTEMDQLKTGHGGLYSTQH